jgi:hypothetical protein
MVPNNKNLLSSTLLAPLQKKDNKHLNDIKKNFEDSIMACD